LAGTFCLLLQQSISSSKFFLGSSSPPSIFTVSSLLLPSWSS
jgi:hypothetical protein